MQDNALPSSPSESTRTAAHDRSDAVDAAPGSPDLGGLRHVRCPASDCCTTLTCRTHDPALLIFEDVARAHSENDRGYRDSRRTTASIGQERSRATGRCHSASSGAFTMHPSAGPSPSERARRVQTACSTQAHLVNGCDCAGQLAPLADPFRSVENGTRDGRPLFLRGSAAILSQRPGLASICACWRQALRLHFRIGCKWCAGCREREQRDGVDAASSKVCANLRLPNTLERTSRAPRTASHAPIRPVPNLPSPQVNPASMHRRDASDKC